MTQNEAITLAKAEATIERSRRLSLILYGLVFVWLCLRISSLWFDQ